jgi:hypothetical protein
MARKLQEAEETIERLQGGENSMNYQIMGASVAESAAPASSSFGAEDVSTRVPPPSGHSTEPVVLETSPATHQSRLQDPPRPTAAIDGISQDALAIDLSVDEHGKICYYGPTSAVHEPLGLASPSTNSMSRGDGSKRTDVRAYLVSRARESTIWEEFALGNASLQLGLPRQVMAKLLHLHWTWVAPMFMWVYRPAFMRTYLPLLRDPYLD